MASEGLNMRGSWARAALHQLMTQRLSRPYSKHRAQVLYTRTTKHADAWPGTPNDTFGKTKFRQIKKKKIALKVKFLERKHLSKILLVKQALRSYLTLQVILMKKKNITKIDDHSLTMHNGNDLLTHLHSNPKLATLYVNSCHLVAKTSVFVSIWQSS